MSVSAFNQSLAPSPDNASLPEAKPDARRATTASSAQVTAGISFNPQFKHCGPVCGGPPPRPLPGGVGPNPGPPPRPLPIGVAPNPYPGKTDEQLAWGLLSNYDAFRGRWPSRAVTTQSILAMANRPLTGDPSKDANIQLARALLQRPSLMRALDREGSTGALDGRLSRDDIRSFIRSDNPLKLSDDRELVREMLKHFNALKGSWFSNSIKLKDIRALAMQPLTGNPHRDHLIQLSREVMSRSDLLSAMDNSAAWLRDGRITRQELFALLR